MSKLQDFQGPLQKFQDFPGLESKFSSSRTFQVFQDHIHSASHSVTCRVLQECVFSPLLIINYTNDLPCGLTRLKCILFADDTTNIALLKTQNNYNKIPKMTREHYQTGSVQTNYYWMFRRQMLLRLLQRTQTIIIRYLSIKSIILYLYAGYDTKNVQH